MLLRIKLFLSGLVLFGLLFSSSVVSVKAASMWSQTYGGAGDDWAFSLVATSDGGYAIAGSTSSFGAGGTDFWLVKTDANGVMQWNRTYGGAEDDMTYSLVATSDGGYALAGYTGSFGAGGDDFWLVKTGALGNMQWNKTYGGPWGDRAYSLVATSDGGYALVGITQPFVDASFDSLLVKIDALGNMEWNRTYGGYAMDEAYSLIETSDGGYAVAGYTESFGAGSADFWLVKTDALGNMEWNQTYGGAGDYDVARSLVTTPDGGYVIAGTAGISGPFLVKTDSFGNMQWSRTSGTFMTAAYSLVAAFDGGYALAGSAQFFGAGGSDFWLIKTDASGNKQWNQTYGGAGNEYASSLVATSDGGYALAGGTSSSGAGGDDFWLVKTNENGVVPEYSSWLVPALVLTATAFIIINKKRLIRTRRNLNRG
jgi:predicted secreted protein